MRITAVRALVPLRGFATNPSSAKKSIATLADVGEKLDGIDKRLDKLGSIDKKLEKLRTFSSISEIYLKV